MHVQYVTNKKNSLCVKLSSIARKSLPNYFNYKENIFIYITRNLLFHSQINLRLQYRNLTRELFLYSKPIMINKG